MATDGAARRMALGAIAASVVIGLAACGSTVAGAASPAKQPATPKPSTSRANPGEPAPLAASKGPLLCAEIPKLTQLSFTRTAWPPDHHARGAQPSAAMVRNTAAVRRIATVLCGLPAVPFGVMSCPDLTGGSYRLYFEGPGRAIPVGIQTSGCRVVTGVGRSRTWATSTALQRALSQGLGARFREAAPPS